MKKHLIYIIAATLLSVAPFITPEVTAQTQDSIMIISSPAGTTDTTDYNTRLPKKIKPARPDNFWRRVSVGGWMSLQFGNITAISVSPEVKVRAFNAFYPGFGLVYQYTLFKDWYIDPSTNQTYDLSSNIIGARVFLRYYLAGILDNWAKNFFAHTEYEYLNYVWKSEKFEDEVVEINSIFVGAGYKQPVSERTFFDFLILFNLNDTPNSPYTNPIFRFGFGVDL